MGSQEKWHSPSRISWRHKGYPVIIKKKGNFIMNRQTQKIRDRLIQRSKMLMAKEKDDWDFTGNPQADKFISSIERYPHAYVIGCIMDRQMPAERAWIIPYELKGRLGYFDFKRLNATRLSTFKRVMRNPTSLHRFPNQMAKNIKSAIELIEEKYKGNASNIWSDKPSSASIVKRFLEFDGVGQKIATMACNILVRDFQIEVSDRHWVDVSLDVHIRRMFRRLGFVYKDASDEYIVYTARELHPEYPGIFDYVLWELGRELCRPRYRDCSNCFMEDLCPSAEHEY